ncbi:hypothetical protein LIER_12845 [Lithospermum erythrorhizon]|uniref:Uncharacterized protein n=1 Tax=Lithospermum erythrorhizon TaxID=34254 RepID=A0AAV3PUP5_LITER
MVLSSWKKSNKTVLLHLGHLGSSFDNMTYMKQRGHPASIIEVVSGLLGHCTKMLSSSGLGSLDTHELAGDNSMEENDVLGDDEFALLGGDKFNFSSSFGLSML